ncbi:MAG: fused MFS/spermidine synthase, partial [Planctomycetes bacterium]|nr:fused MFS/spermidine synthase [Planctomycetota bacterium]
ALAGALTIAIRFLSPVMCQSLWRLGAGTRLGALGTSAALFFIPGVLLGMVSPFAVRLAARAVADIGRTSGVLYALSTLGSIFGTLITSFVLIDFVGTGFIVVLQGIVLVVLALVFAVVSRFGRAAAGELSSAAARGHASAPAAPVESADATPRPNALRLKIIVVACGAALMGLEIAAARIISPYFGHGVYVWGSLISIFLAALSLGYYIGGRLADRRPSLALLGSIIAASCVVLLALRYVAPGICEAVLGMELGVKLGTLVTCIVLFFIPSVLLGIVSPFAVRLAARAVADIGKTAGTLYAASTLGSIVGTLAVSFVLIDLIGANWIVLALGVLLILTAVVGAGRIPRRGAVSVPVVLAMVLIPVSLFVDPPRPRGIIAEGYRVIHDTDSAYQHIVVCEGEDPYNRRLRRDLQFDRYIESAIYIDDIEKDDPDPDAATTYTNLMHLPMIFNPDAATMLMIGGGGGTLPRQYQRHYGCDVDVAEIDPKVVQIAKQFFYLRPNDNLRVHVEDGRMYLKRTDKAYDVILIDAFSGGGNIPFHLTTKEFFSEAKDRLAPGGVLAMNVISALEGRDGRLYRSIHKTLRETGFEQIYVFPRHFTQSLDRIRSTNIILVAMTSGERLGKDEIVSIARDLHHTGPVRVKDFVYHAKHYLPEANRHSFKDAPVLTDDYAPVELMAPQW